MIKSDYQLTIFVAQGMIGKQSLSIPFACGTYFFSHKGTGFAAKNPRRLIKNFKCIIKFKNCLYIVKLGKVLYFLKPLCCPEENEV